MRAACRTAERLAWLPNREDHAALLEVGSLIIVASNAKPVVQQTLGHACSHVSEVDFDTTSDENKHVLLFANLSTQETDEPDFFSLQDPLLISVQPWQQ